MVSSGDLPDNVRERAEAALASVDPIPFSPAAFDRFKGKVVQYIAALYEESIKISRRLDADAVSASHVEKASDALVSLRSALVARHVGMLGGLLVGVGGSQLTSMVAANTFTSGGVLLAVTCGCVGFAGLAWHFAKER